MDALSAQDKAQPGTAPEWHKELRGQDSHGFSERRLEREMNGEMGEQAEKDDLRRRMDDLAAQEKEHLPQNTAGPPVISEGGVSYRYLAATAKDYPELQPGKKVTFCVDEDGRPVGTAEKHADGTIRVWTCINDGTGSLAGGGRQGYESALPRGSEVGLGHVHLHKEVVEEPYVRAHAAGQGCGPESPYGITLAPNEINSFQNYAPEEDIRALAERAKPGVRLEQTVCVSADESGRAPRLRTVDYEVDAISPHDGSRHTLYRHGLEITGGPGHERIELHRNERGEPGPTYYDTEIEKYLT
jgi:hypothetical protein